MEGNVLENWGNLLIKLQSWDLITVKPKVNALFWSVTFLVQKEEHIQRQQAMYIVLHSWKRGLPRSWSPPPYPGP